MSLARKNSREKHHGRNSDLEQFAYRKVIPDILKEEILTALSYYPMLRNTCIHFEFKDNFRKHFMQAQPIIDTMFRKPENREYVILMNRYFKIEDEQIFIDDMPFNVLVGWIGHELGHIMDYRHRGFFSLVKFGIGYLTSKSFVIGAERVADTYAIRQGLADNIIATKNYILNHGHLPERFKRKIRKLYMAPEEVMMIVERENH